MKNLKSIGLAMFFALLASGASSEEPYVGTVITGKIDRIWIDHANFAGCQARLSVPVQGVDGLTCGRYNWVHFNCQALEGVGSKADGQAKLQMAQLAFLTDRDARMGVSNAVVVNGKCFVEWIDVIR